jgi:membrane protein YdbS with pleckstrin-like domain
MKCNQCGADVPASSAFCPRCGAQLRAAAGAPSGAARMQPAALADVPEEELWSGGYSWHAMTGTFVLATIVTMTAIVGGTFFPPFGTLIGIGLAVLMYAYLGIELLFRRMAVRYRLTSQRLIIERGVLGRTNDRVLVVEIDDLSVKQGAFERMFNVGSIVLDTKDKNTLDGTSPNSSVRTGEGILTMSGIENPSYVADLIDKARHAERTRRGLYTVNA